MSSESIVWDTGIGQLLAVIGSEPRLSRSQNNFIVAAAGAVAAVGRVRVARIQPILTMAAHNLSADLARRSGSIAAPPPPSADKLSAL